MAATVHREPNHRGVPREVTLRQDELAAPRFTPRELRIIKEQLGRSFMQLIQDEGDDEKFAVMAWLKLRREGHDLDYARHGRCRHHDRRRGPGPYERAAGHNLAAFCRFWRMTPRQVDELTQDEYLAFWRYAEQTSRDQEREQRRAA